jgi:threonyl-tRNA synthetase
MQIHITFPDGAVRAYPAGITALEIAKSISEGLARNVLSAKVNGEVWDATRPINEDASLALLTWNDADGKKTFWHSSAHLLAEALEALYPGIKLGIGPPIENGFYYDIDFGDRIFSSEEFAKVEAKMNELAKQENTFVRREMPKQAAIEYFTTKQDPY